ncbi:MAG: Rieske 2Fe-2S domain-containing protein [Pseudomonadota bacterium]|uniref:Rieske (2Fe-2S) protein n=1 Tax=Roseixanthobacter finlandensis TaxID=3119922 RepID=UPI003726B858
MSPGEIQVFVICAASSIAPGGVKSFRLSRVVETGENRETRPFPIFIVRTLTNDYFGYSNVCPHEGRWLNIGSGEFFTPDGEFLRCGRHGATFEIDTGACVKGPCKGKNLEPLALAVVDGEVCVCGIELVEDDGFPDPFSDLDETMEIMIHPE